MLDTGVCRLLVLAVVAFLSAPLAWCKDNPAPEWAVTASRIATPAYAKDSSAVILTDQYEITVDEQNHAIERELYAVRILTPKGRSWGEMNASYDADMKLEYFRCWTIAQDGRQFEAKATDFHDRGSYSSGVYQSTDRYRELTPPAGDPGNVVACESQVHLPTYINEKLWHVQLSIPSVLQSLQLNLPAGKRFSAAWHRLAPQLPVELPGNRLRWEFHDVPELDLKNVYATPSFSTLTGRASIQWGDSIQKDATEQWKQIGLWRENLNVHRTGPTPAIAAKASELTAGSTDFYDKLKRIGDYIQKNVQYFIIMKGIGGQQAHPAAEIFRTLTGDCKDKSTLLIAMLESIGVKAHYLTVDSRRGFIDPKMPSVFGNHMITAIELPADLKDNRFFARANTSNGKPLLIFDPTDEETPMGMVGAYLQGSYGYLSDGEDSQLLQIPAQDPAATTMTIQGKLTLQQDGSLTGDLMESLTGDNAGSWRYRLKHTQQDKVRENLEKQLGSEIPALSFKGYEFRNAQDTDKPVELDLHFSATNYMRASGGLILFRPRVFSSHSLSAPDILAGKPREYPIVLGHTGHWREVYNFQLPEGFAVDELAGEVKLDLDFASYHSKTVVEGHTLRYEREYIRRAIELPADRVGDVRRMDNVILNDEKGMAILKRQ